MAKKKTTTNPKKKKAKKTAAKKSIAIPITTVPIKKEKKKEGGVSRKETHTQEEKPKESLFDEEVVGDEDVAEEKSVVEAEKKKSQVLAKKPKAKMKSKKKKLSKKKKTWIIIGGILGVLVVVGVILRLIFGGGGVFEGENINLEVNGPEKAVAGEEITYEIHFTNNEDVSLDSITVDVVYPDNFILIEASPKATNFNETKWGPKSISSGESLDIKLTGKLIGNEGDQKELSVKVDYKPSNFSSSFTEEDDVMTVLSKMEVDIDMEVPDIITSGSEFTLSVEVKNDLEYELESLRLRMNYPSSFEYKSSKPRPDLNFNVFDINKIGKGESEVIQIKGVLTGDAKDKNEIKAVFGLVDDKNDFFPQAEKTLSVKISEVLAEIDTKIYGTAANAMSPGETLEYKVKYKNTGTEAFKEVVIETNIDTKYLNMDSFVIENGGKRDNGKVYWDRESFEALETVNPNDEGEFTFKVRIADTITVKKQDESNFLIKARSFFRAKGTESNPDKPILVESKNAVTKINSQVSLDVEGHYYDFEGRKVGSGPLPPAVGKKSTYRVYVLLSNKLNEVDNGIVEVNIPDGVALTGGKSTNVGTITLEKQKISWKIGKIPAGTGQFSQNLEAYFDVSIIPGVSQVGSVVSLTGETNFTGIDTYTTKKIGTKVSSINSDLTNDPFAQGKGVVVEKEVEFSNDGTDSGPMLEGYDNLDEPDQEEGTPIR